VLLMWLLASLGVCFVLEQPRGSYLQRIPRFREFRRAHKLWRKEINMSDVLTGAA